MLLRVFICVGHLQLDQTGFQAGDANLKRMHSSLPVETGLNPISEIGVPWFEFWVLGLDCLIHAISPWDVNQDAAHVAMILDIEKAAKIRTEDSVNRSPRFRLDVPFPVARVCQNSRKRLSR